MDLRGVRVLLVEDSLDSRDLLVMMLRVKNVDVRAASNGAEARALLEQWRPDVIVSDIGMPGEDGYEMMAKIRALRPEQGGSLPAIALTAFGDRRARERAYNAGFQRHIVKPGDVDALLVAIGQLSGRLSAA
jgi:CheY-like chemotaxis protein